MKINSVTMVVGQRGSGKSVYLKRLLFDKPRVIVFDVNEEYHYMRKVGTLRRLAEIIEEEDSFHLAFVPKNVEHDLPLFCKLAMMRGKVTIVFDEAHVIAPLHSIDHELTMLITRGRHKEVDLIFATQRLALVSKLMTSQANRTIFFKLTEPRDVQAASEWLGTEADQLKTLQTGERIERNF